MIETYLILINIFTPIARGGVNTITFMLIGLGAFCLAFICAVKMRRAEGLRIKRTSLDIWICLFLLIAMASFIKTKYFYGSITEFIKLLGLALIFYFTVHYINNEARIKRMLNVILATATFITLFGILQYLGALDKTWWANEKFLSATYVNHNHFAGYLGLIIPISAGMIMSTRETGKKLLYVYSFIVLSSALLFTMSRGAWISILIAAIFVFTTILKREKSYLVIIMFVLLLIAAAAFIYYAVDTNVLFKRMRSLKELDFSGRLEIWKGTLGVIKDNTLLGTGIGTFIYNFPAYRPSGLNMFINYGHNDYLQVMSEMGIFGLIIMVYIIFKAIKKAVGTHHIAISSFKRWTSLSLAAGIMSMAIHSVADFNFYIPANVILFTVYIGLIFNIYSGQETRIPDMVLKFGQMPYRVIKLTAVAFTASLIILTGISLAAEICLAESSRALSRNDLEKAGYMAEAAIKICPWNSYARYSLYSVYSAKANQLSNRPDFLEKSKNSLLEALALNPIDGRLWLALADTYYGLFKDSIYDNEFVKKADSAYRKAVILDPSNSYYLKKYAAYLLNIGEERLSSGLYRKAYSIMSKSRTLSLLSKTFLDGNIYKDIARMAFQGQDTEKALTFYKMAEELLDDKTDAYLGQVRCYLRMHLLREAMRKYRNIEPSGKSRAVFFAGLADYYLAGGYLGLANGFAKKSLTLYPNNPEACQVLYKMWKKEGPKDYAAGLISSMLNFNEVKLSYSLDAGSLEIRFDIKRDMAIDGLMKMDLVLPSGIYELSVRAKGKEAQDVWPHMIIRFNNQQILNVYVNSEGWRMYDGIVIVDYPFNTLEIGYDNDYFNAEKMEDRNLYIDGLRMKELW